MQNEDLTFYSFDGNKENLMEFFDNYEIENIFIPPDSAVRNLKKRPDRVCRYCGLGANQTTFKKEAHIIPHLMGNRYMVSDFECDSCNELFSKYENHLTDFLGITRTIFGTDAKKGTPNYRSRNAGLSAKALNLPSDHKAIVISDNNGENFEIDDDSGRTEISYQKNKYIPLFVYKSFLKIALGLIKPDDVINYKYAFEHLIHSQSDVQLGKVATINEYSYTRNCKVHCYLFRKRRKDDLRPTHIFQIYYENLLYQFFIPLNLEDLNLYDGKEFTIKWCPPLLLWPPKEGENCRSRARDLSGLEKIDEEGLISMEFLPGTMKTLSSYDPITKVFIDASDFDMQKIVKILLVPQNPDMDFKEIFKDGLPPGY
ncbi:HNH endonuclease [Pedobacter frigoris]|uniref:HNH endonuclease n=1 Tax=Pedobacter frigoris TaxID=2571272 RepID=A0A4U1CCA0_9SPHI|nr:HNH endonuclease [Pedobacter frigoris]TKC04359.1 HNH endonuclease [Pedobacter frigoris]